MREPLDSHFLVKITIVNPALRAYLAKMLANSSSTDDVLQEATAISASIDASAIGQRLFQRGKLHVEKRAEKTGKKSFPQSFSQLGLDSSEVFRPLESP